LQVVGAVCGFEVVISSFLQLSFIARSSYNGTINLIHYHNTCYITNKYES